MRTQFLLLFCLAFTFRLALVFLSHQYRDLERYELENVAISLATHGAFADPYAIPTGPTAHVSPAYPLLLSLIFRFLGTGIPAEIVKQTLASAVSALACALMPWVAGNLGFSRSVGLLSGLACALLPLKLSTETMGDWETNYEALALMLLAVLTMRTWHRGDYSNGRAALSGLAWGVALLFVSALLPLYVVLLVLTLAMARFANWRFALVQTIVVAACLAPWAIRNQLALGSPIYTRSNFGIEFRVSNNDQATAIESVNYVTGVYHRYHPFQSVAQAARVRAVGEVAFNRELTGQAAQWVREHPSRFATLTLQRAWYYWFPPDRGQTVKRIILWGTVILACGGLVLWIRRREWSAWLIATLLLVVPLPNYLVHVGLRHKFPIDWLDTLLACYFVLELWTRFRAKTSEYVDP